MFWRRGQSGTTTSAVTTETATTQPATEPMTEPTTETTPVSEQPIGSGQPAETPNQPEEVAIFEAVHAPAATEGGATVATETGAVAPTPAETETLATQAGDQGQAAKGKKAKADKTQAEKGEKARGGGGAFGFGLLLGAGLGAVAALLFAPKSGEEMRSELVETGMGLKNQATDTASNVDWRPTASPWAGQAADAVQAATTSAETTLRDAGADAQQAASDLKDDTEDRIQKF